MERIDCLIIGAGVVGLALARALARQGREVVIAEAQDAFGTGTSSRNSEVIHAGIYYRPGSLKAELAVRGRDQLYAYCAAQNVAHRRIGKLIVANSSQQMDELEALRKCGVANGVDDLELLDSAAARRLEPELRCHAALWSPSTGIIDSHALMLSLLGDAERAGAVLALKTTVRRAAVTRDGICVDIGTDADDDATTMQLNASLLVNCAGLSAVELASKIDGLPATAVPSIRFTKGSYFVLGGRAPFQRLIYPLPEPGGLGVHLTLDLAGQARFGPDAEALASRENIDYRVDPARAVRFYESVRQYWPALPEQALQPGYAGIRPQVQARDGSGVDFRIEGPREHGVPGLVNLFGIESPGLTTALALADRVVEMID